MPVSAGDGGVDKIACRYEAMALARLLFGQLIKPVRDLPAPCLSGTGFNADVWLRTGSSSTGPEYQAAQGLIAGDPDAGAGAQVFDPDVIISCILAEPGQRADKHAFIVFHVSQIADLIVPDFTDRAQAVAGAVVVQGEGKADLDRRSGGLAVDHKKVVIIHPCFEAPGAGIFEVVFQHQFRLSLCEPQCFGIDVSPSLRIMEGVRKRYLVFPCFYFPLTWLCNRVQRGKRIRLFVCAAQNTNTGL